MEKRLPETKGGHTVRIAVTGPESTGKTTLSEQLARHFEAAFRPEYARKYLDLIKRPYTFDDIEKIASEQVKAEDKLLLQYPRILIADTDLIVIKIWMEVKYKHCPAWILREINDRPYDLYFLCDIDFPWEADPQREHPHLRQYLFDLYFKELNDRKFNFAVISGEKEQRFSQAVKLVEKCL